MREYVPTLEPAAPEEPLYGRISRSLAGDIVRERLKPGERLPGSRKLALLLGVHRNTVHAALAELEAQGWVEARPARGVFVRAQSTREGDLPLSRAGGAPKGASGRLGFDLADAPAPRPRRETTEGTLVLTGGVPDPRLFPSELLARAYRRVLRQRGERLLDYGESRGEPRLRAALADMLRRLRGLAGTEQELIITRGSQQAIWLAAHALLRPGDRVGVESLGYPPAWDALRSTGAELVPLEIDGDGVRIDSIESALEGGALRALYLTPHHQYPTTVALSGLRRLRLLELARRHRIAILEDDYAHEFHYEGRPRLPLASDDRQGVVVYIGSLSKVLAPGLRIGFAVAPRALIERMAALRLPLDRQGDGIGEAAVAELIEDGSLERHMRRMKQLYLGRRQLLAQELRRRLGDRLEFELPPGGMAFWVRVHGASPSSWVARAEERGVSFRAGRELSLVERGELPYVRMGHTRLDEAEIVRAVRLAALAFPTRAG